MLKESKLIFGNQSGVALVVALLMIVILSLIGIASSSNSTFEIKLSGNKRGSTDAFYTADTGLVSIQADIGNFSASYDTETGFKGTWEGDVRKPPLYTDNFNSFTWLYPARQELKGEFTNRMLMTSSSPSFSKPGTVSFTAPAVVRMIVDKAVAPRGLGLSALAFKYNYYIIDSIGYDQLDLSLTRSQCEIREKIVRLIPTDQGGY